jgi:hypothetical protein
LFRHLPQPKSGEHRGAEEVYATAAVTLLEAVLTVLAALTAALLKGPRN